MDLPAAVALVEHLLDAHFPAATTAVIGGSTAHGATTPTSDIDLVLIGPSGMLPDGSDSLAETIEFDGQAIEIFGYTPRSFAEWAERGIDQLRPVIVQMLVDGNPVRGGAELVALRERWGPVLEAGPTCERSVLDARRYDVTSLIDDLRDNSNPVESRYLAGLLYERLGSLLLVTRGRWIATGKDLPRRLTEADPEAARALGDALVSGDMRRFVGEAERLLDGAGGRLSTGYRR